MMMNRLTETQGKMLCQLTHMLRREWDLPGIEAVVRDVSKTADGLDLARALLNLAGNPNAKTPGMLKHPGKHWPTDDQGQPKRTPDMPHPTCPDHPRELYPCALCRPDLRPATREGIAAVREAAQQAKLTARALLHTPNPTLAQLENARRNNR